MKILILGDIMGSQAEQQLENLSKIIKENEMIFYN